MSDSCPYLDVCAVHQGKLADKKGMTKMFKRRYCKDNYDNCARYRIVNTVGGSHVEEGLLPNQNDKADRIINEVSAS
ncbi:MAG: hypothetical protein R6V17_04300 [Halanaerobacter sp.]